MNKTVAFIGLGAAVCMTAPAFAQDTHLSLTKERVASMHEITAALDKVTPASPACFLLWQRLSPALSSLYFVVLAFFLLYS